MADLDSSPVFVNNSLGWKRWKFLSTRVDSGVNLPFGKIPTTYLPSNKIWVEAEAINCVINLPWSFRDAFQEFIVPATTGGIIGAVAGLNNAADVLAEQQMISFGLSGSVQLPAKISYCIGNLFKEEVYTYIYAVKLPITGILSEAKEDIICRSVYKRIYVTHGEINSIEKYVSYGVSSPGYYVLKVGINKTQDEDVFFTTPDAKTSEKEILILDVLYPVIGITKDFGLIVYDPNSVTSLKPSQFFELNWGMCLEDPLLMDGFWEGAKNDITKTPFEYFFTSTNKAWDSNNFTGMYITVDTEGNAILPPNTDVIVSSKDIKWKFYPFADTENHYYGKDKKRYEIFDINTSVDSSSRQYVEIEVATEVQYQSFLKLSPSYYRLEMKRGGDSSATNFHYPCLSGQFILYNGKMVKILRQIDGFTIDISSKYVDGKSYVFSDLTYVVYNQYAWMFNEYYMGTDRKPIFSGVIKNVTPNSDKKLSYAIEVEISESSINLSTRVDLPPKNLKLSYLPVKSFWERFINNKYPTISESNIIALTPYYNKGEGWKFNVNYKTYDVTSLSSVSKVGVKYSVVFNVTIKDETFKTSDIIDKQSFITFDNIYEKDGDFNGSLNIECNLGGGKSNVDTKLCLSGYWISPELKLNLSNSNQYIGICDGLYFGVTDNIALSNNLATIFFTTPAGGLSMSSFKDLVSTNEMIFYHDAITRKITARTGSFDFKEYPQKIEVTIGDSKFIETSTSRSGVEISMDTAYERVKKMWYTCKEKTKLLTFGVKSKNNYYGIPVTGEGKVSLLPINSNNVSSSNYKYDGYFVSPVYEYVKNDNKSVGAIYIGAPTSDKYIYSSSSIDNVKFEYVNDKQTIETNSLFDTHLLDTGEIILVYRDMIREFNLEVSKSVIKLNNPSDKNVTNTVKAWKYSSNAIFIIGSKNWGETWQSPISAWSSNNKYAVCVLNSVDYLASIIKDGILFLFIKCYNEDGTTYLGLYKVSVQSLFYKAFKCTTTVDDIVKEPVSFYYRPPALNDSKIKHLPADNIVIDDFSFSSDTVCQDSFVKISGNIDKSNNLKITVAQDDIISLYFTKTGVLFLLFSNTIGINVLYSTDNGMNWKLSPVIAAYDANSGVIINGNIFFISSSGIDMKNTTDEDICDIFIVEDIGSNKNIIEQKQNKINYFTARTVYVGDVQKYQRMSGYVNEVGMTKLFCYAGDMSLLCVEGCGTSVWKVADNF